MQILSKKYKYKGKDGKDYTGYNFYLSLENGRRIAIKPAFYKDIQKLVILSTAIDLND